MLLDRWSPYVANANFGNKDLKNIVTDPNKSFDYVKEHFDYSILENYNSLVDKEYVLKRESWRKVILGKTEPLGYNQN